MADKILDWLLEGDISIQYQVYRDLHGNERRDLRSRIAKEGWGSKFLSFQNENGHWGIKFYQPKWTSTHYTLLDLKNLGLPPGHPNIRKTIRMLLREEKGPDGGINPSSAIKESDVCLNGMFLNYASYFKTEETELHSIADFILLQRMDDGGFNCMYNRWGARHASLHSTLSVAEGIREYLLNGYTYRLPELKEAEAASQEFILKHRLYLSDRTGKVIKNEFLRLPYPSRWRYDILRALDYFRTAGISYDDRMRPAIDILLKKRKNHVWTLAAPHAGQRHFDMEEPGKPSRWNTLRALRVLSHFRIDH
ncbi:MAG: hypothetical protein JXB26_00330 [Candidatus Aminicenantes bacterium]|nr:hypothetical protein [Candidatus Aminicenantes bacterium]